MYTKHFNLTQRPFSRVPSATGCVMFPGLKSCFERACDGIEACAGPVLVIGASGCGKSTFLALLEKRFTPHLATVTLNCAAIASRHELIQCLLFELGLPFQSENVGELRLKLIDHLKSPEHCPNGLLVLVDEAHNLSMEVLEELRMITNLVCGSRQQIRLVVAGHRALEEKLVHPQLESFSQRIGVRCYLQPMTRSETMYYALAQMQMCGRDGREIFKPSALERIYDITDGIPRLAAQLCDHTLKLAAEADVATIDGRLAQQAWLDLQQLPAMEEIEPAASGPENGIIEFGSLEETPAAATGESPAMGLDEKVPDEIGPSQDPATEPRVETALEDLLREIDAMEQEEEFMASRAPAEPAAPAASATPSRETPQADNRTPAEPVSSEAVSSVEAVSSIEVDSSGEPQTAEGSGDQSGVAADSLAEALASAREMADEQYQRDRLAKQRGGLTPAAYDLFGEFFEEEEIVAGVSSPALADQNRLSSALTSEQLSGLRPVETDIDSEQPSSQEDPRETGPQAIQATPPESAAGIDALPPRQTIDPSVAFDPSAVEMPATAAEHLPLDDADMLVVEEPAAAVENRPDPEPVRQPPSQGQVIRMNYQDLFQQLRNQSPQTPDSES